MCLHVGPVHFRAQEPVIFMPKEENEVGAVDAVGARPSKINCNKGVVVDAEAHCSEEVARGNAEVATDLPRRI